MVPDPGGALFTVGALGLLIRRNVLVMFMCIELMLNAANLTFVTFSRMLNDIGGQVLVFFVLVVAAAEVVVGLGIVVAIFRRRARRYRRRPALAEGLSLVPCRTSPHGPAAPGGVRGARGGRTAAGRPPGRVGRHRRGAGSFVVACIALAGLLSEPASARHFTENYFTWIPVGGLQVHVGVLLDPLSMTMCMFVTGVSG